MFVMGYFLVLSDMINYISLVVILVIKIQSVAGRLVLYNRELNKYCGCDYEPVISTNSQCYTTVGFLALIVYIYIFTSKL